MLPVNFVEVSATSGAEVDLLPFLVVVLLLSICKVPAVITTIIWQLLTESKRFAITRN